MKRGRKRDTLPFHITDHRPFEAATARPAAPQRAADTQEQLRDRLFQTSESYRRAVQNLARRPTLTNRMAADRLRAEYAAAERAFTAGRGRRQPRGYRLPPSRPVPKNLRLHLSRSHGVNFRPDTSELYLRGMHVSSHESSTRNLLKHRHPGLGPVGQTRIRRAAAPAHRVKRKRRR